MKRIIIALLLSIAIIPTTSAQKKEKMPWRDRYFEHALTYSEGNTFKYNNYIIERIEAEEFNFQDKDIRFNIFFISDTQFWIRIYNTSNQEMICR